MSIWCGDSREMLWKAWHESIRVSKDVFVCKAKLFRRKAAVFQNHRALALEASKKKVINLASPLQRGNWGVATAWTKIYWMLEIVGKDPERGID